MIRARRPALLVLLALVCLTGPARAAESAEVAEEVARAVAELSLKLRGVVVLRYFEGLSYEEIAAVIGRSVGTVKSRLSRAHQRLAERLQRFC